MPLSKARFTILLLLGVSVFAPALRADDLVELLSGAKVRGKVTARDEQSVTVAVTIGSREVTRKYPTSSIHAITTKDRREVLHALGDKPATTIGAGKTVVGKAAAGEQRTKAEIDTLITQVGRQPPDWFESTELKYPQTLDLSWPKGPAPGGWNNQKNVGQYIWDIINTNPGRWKEGVRLLHHLLTLHKDDPQKTERNMLELGRMYHNLIEDYARSAFWYRQVGADKNPQEFTTSAVKLAECYWRLGSKSMAVELLNRAPITLDSIKLWGDMGDTPKALAQADMAARQFSRAPTVWMAAGDACRVAGRAKEAASYYQKVLDFQPPTPNDKVWVDRVQRRARPSLEAIKLFDTLDVARVADGTYSGSSLGYEAQVKVEVKVQTGRIESVKVTEHREKQFYSSLTDTPRKIIEKQSVRGIDATSAATITSEAIINATAKALAQGMK